MDQTHPKKILIHKDIKLIDITGGYLYTLFLCSSGELYKAGKVCKEIAVYRPTLLSTRVVNRTDKIIGITCGPFHFLCVSNRGNVYSMGDNSCGQLCLGTIDDSEEIRFVELLKNEGIKSISCKESHSSVLTKNNKILIFGIEIHRTFNCVRRYKKNIKLRKIRSRILKNVEQIHCGDKCTYAITNDGKFYCRGDNMSYQFGMMNPRKSSKFILNKNIKILKRISSINMWLFDPLICSISLDIILICV